MRTVLMRTFSEWRSDNVKIPAILDHFASFSSLRAVGFVLFEQEESRKKQNDRYTAPPTRQ